MRFAAHFEQFDWRSMMDSMEPWQWQEWLAFCEVEGFGEDRDDRRFATMTKLLMDVWCPESVDYAKVLKAFRDDVEDEAATRDGFVSPDEGAAIFRRMMGR